MAWLDVTPLLRVSPFPLAAALATLIIMRTLVRLERAYVLPVSRSAVVESMSDGIIVLDSQNRIMDLNPVAQRLTNSAPETAIGQPIEAILPDIRRPREEPAVGKELVLATKEGERIYDMRLSPLIGLSGDPLTRIIVLRDITERRNAEEQVRYLSYHDQLTGLYNRAFFEEEMRRLDSGRQLPVSIILGDVNGLKLVNDAFGHLEGDSLLCNVAKAVRQSCRGEDIVARWGGDEFVVLLPRTAQEEAMEVCERIRSACDGFSQSPVRLSIALGTATKGHREEDNTAVLKVAEERMYRNKLLESRSARNGIISSLQQSLSEISLETEEHGLRLRSLALGVGRQLKLPAGQLDELGLLAVLHDIGKIAVAPTILTSPGQLSAVEWDIIKKHPEVGYRIAVSCT